MATVVVTYPRDGGTYGTQADGSLVPFVATGYVDVPGQVVTVYENGSSALLGAVAADVVPEDQGAFVGWYYWAVPIVAWTAGGAGVLVPAAQGTATAANISLAATVPVPAATGTASAGDVSTSATTLLGVPAGSGTAAAGGVSFAGALGVGAGTGTASAGDISIASDATAPSVGTLTVPDTTGTSITGITASATDAVGVVGWKILEQAADSGWSSPGAGDAGWTSVSSTTSFSSSALTFTSTASSTATRYFRIYFKDAAGNVGGSATDSAVITIASSGVSYVAAGSAVSSTYGNGTPVSIPLPASVQTNDILVLFAGGGLYSSVDPPVGWTLASSFAGSGFVAGGVYWKRAGSSESDPTVTIYGDDGEGPVSTTLTARIYSYQGCPTSGSPFASTAGTNSGTGTSISGSSRTTDSDNAMMLMLGGSAGVSAAYSSPGVSVDTIVSAANASGSQFMAYDDAPSNTAGTASAPTCTASASAGWSTVTVALKAA